MSQVAPNNVKAAKALTPAMQQYQRFKQQHPHCVLFFRMGDFYEMFHDDAKLAHKVLGVTLTQRTEGVPMAGVPYHSVEGYLRRMIQAGHRVAVCEQVEDAAQAKASGSVVKRDVTRVVTPGTITDESLLDEGQENPLAAVVFHGPARASAKSEIPNPKSEIASIAWAELSTGTFHVATLDVDELIDELARVHPRELIYCETANGEPPARVRQLADTLNCSLTPRPAWQMRQEEAVDQLRKQYGVAQLTGFGFEEDDLALAPAGAIVHYLLETQCLDVNSNSKLETSNSKLSHLQPPRRFVRNDHMVIDQTSLRSLEVERTLRSGEVAGSLLATLQAGSSCVTAMGKRLLRHWLCYPLREREPIEHRQRVVGALVDDARFLDELRDALDGVQDVQRITARLAVNRATPRDLVALGRSAAQIRQLERMLADRPTVAHYHAPVDSLVEPLESLANQITEACVEEPPGHLRDGGLIRDGYDSQLDEYRNLQRDSHDWLARYQKELIDTTDLPSLKVGYNKVFGYYIELTRANRDKAPDNWTRKQTLKNAERFITPELKEYEQKVLSAESRGVSREQALFAELCELARQQTVGLHRFAELVAELDALGCFARRAVRHRYVKPTIVDEPVLHVDAGRHPVLDELLGEQFVPNDVALGTAVSSSDDSPASSEEASANSKLETRNSKPQASLALITGPNMAGKSTYIRQAALITLLAHTGSFVPAASATVGLCDRIFTRIGASDELHTGQSTFMVEMTETANICHHATDRSLVILDEIGRGTSTLDGLSLAWALAEHLAQIGPRCLFATHYHELTALADEYDNVTNLNVTVREWQDQIVFLHRIAPGKTDRSYGIHVAKIAGLPQQVVNRANELLSQLAVNHEKAPTPAARTKAGSSAKRDQLPLFTEYVDHPAIDALRQVDLTQLTPMQAFDILRQLREQVEDAPDA
ncbi:DNA mismatch repair protein MutS [Phycisphaerales bacterium AB-hyl4]|uniref:DNA mismatch repair protein MutS n=1 Tax=Natronomicrosphaera hydrolytica TaxID=3242702 RepID=A0ABV4U6W4_9BACT